MQSSFILRYIDKRKVTVTHARCLFYGTAHLAPMLKINAMPPATGDRIATKQACNKGPLSRIGRRLRAG